MTRPAARQKVLCPSAQGRRGALLLGRVQENNEVAFANFDIRVTDAFVEAAKAASPDGNTEYGYRFANVCVKKRCQQWDGTQCTVSSRMLRLLEDMTTEELPDCRIRADCRWYAQEGEEICRRCTYVTTRRVV